MSPSHPALWSYSVCVCVRVCVCMCREAGLPPYVPQLVFKPQLFINYNNTVGTLTNIYSTPSGLESTSLVLACGLGKKMEAIICK